MYQNIYPNPIQLQNSINLIQDTINSMEQDFLLYNWLSDKMPISEFQTLPSPNAEELYDILEIIETLKNDNINNRNLLKEIYYQLTGTYANIKQGFYFVPPRDLFTGIYGSIVKSTKYVKQLGLIMFGLPNYYYRDALFSIISDELNHGTLLNYVYSKLIRIQNEQNLNIPIQLQ
ncbi:hypothetical protein NSA24_02380 [Clostridioides mangenotii]|uniref:hypothetical protein n=1 Tax=Metaclostridioides mangenotii TaxID=1540 RepID=UPI001C11EDF8|nr:hypothetical protein [Clostridioides mangenotii]MBU5308078.1 hypothetical protein [Clostridioides mangenotii]MCR1953679.1 hypothetical protein [Clostridioides mangenotii]